MYGFFVCHCTELEFVHQACACVCVVDLLATLRPKPIYHTTKKTTKYSSHGRLKPNERK